MPHDVIISHSTAGNLTAYAICCELESIGIRCWILPRDLSIGVPWDQSMVHAVASCRIMIVVLADYASRSDRIERQLEHAFNNEVIVIPFRIESNSADSGPPLSPDPVHWLDALTPEMAQRLRSLRDLVAGLTLRQKDPPLPVMALPTVEKEIPRLSIERVAELTPPDTTKDKPPLPASDAVAELSKSDAEEDSLPAPKGLVESEAEGQGRAVERPEKISKRQPIKALLLTLLPFAIICGIGVWRAQKGNPSGTAKSVAVATASTSPATSLQVQHQDKFPASDPGWGTLDANWTVTDGKLQVAPLLNSSAVLINRARGFTDAEITADIVMSKGEDLDQLGGLIFWAKDYNDCYALVVSADGKFAVGRKLLGRWINPIAKTGNTSVGTGIGRTNKLRVRTEGNVLKASINGIEVATVSGEPPPGVSYIGLYGESAETSQNVWEFANVTVTSAH